MALTIVSFSSLAQSAVSKLGFSFQGYAIDPDGKALGNTAITVKFTVYNSVQNFSEEQNLTSDAFGVFTAIIGNASTISNNNFAKLRMMNGTEGLTLKVEVKKTSGGVYTTISDAPLASVPYARKADNGVPAGTIIAFAGNDIPDGWLYCDGATYDPAQYPELAAALGNAWGTNYLPDLRGAFLRGIGVRGDGVGNPDRAARGNYHNSPTGDNVGSFESCQIIRHGHGGSSTTAAGNHNHSKVKNGSTFSRLVIANNCGYYNGTQTQSCSFPVTSPAPNLSDSEVMADSGDHSHGLNIVSEGGNEARPYNAAVKYIIKY